MKTEARYYLVDMTHARWPGVMGWKDRDAAAKNRGYRSEEEAERRARMITTAYAAKHGSRGGPDLRVRRA